MIADLLVTKIDAATGEALGISAVLLAIEEQPGLLPVYKFRVHSSHHGGTHLGERLRDANVEWLCN